MEWYSMIKNLVILWYTLLSSIQSKVIYRCGNTVVVVLVQKILKIVLDGFHMFSDMFYTNLTMKTITNYEKVWTIGNS